MRDKRTPTPYFLVFQSKIIYLFGPTIHTVRTTNQIGIKAFPEGGCGCLLLRLAQKL